MKSLVSLLLTLCLFTLTNLLATPWGQSDSEDKIDPNPWMWKLRGSLYATPDAVVSAIAKREGVWEGIFSRFDTAASSPEWKLFEKRPNGNDEFESKVLWRTADLAIVYAYAYRFRTEMCAVWILLSPEELNKAWEVRDVVIRRDVAYSHVKTNLFESVKEVIGPILLIDTYRGGRREGDQFYELYRVEGFSSESNSGGSVDRPSLAFRRCLNVETLYRQQGMWRGKAEFSLTENSRMKVEMLRGNYVLETENRSTIELEWQPERQTFNATPMEQFIGIKKLEQEDQETSKAVEDNR